MTLSRPDLSKLMQVSWPRLPEELVPGIGPETHDTGEGSLLLAKSYGSHERGHIGTERSDQGSMPITGIDCYDEKDCGASQRCRYSLWDHMGDIRRPRRHRREAGLER